MGPIGTGCAYGAREEAGLSERDVPEDAPGLADRRQHRFSGDPGVPPPPARAGRGDAPGRTGGAPVAMRWFSCGTARSTAPVPRQLPGAAGVDVVDMKGQWITPGLVAPHVEESGRPSAQPVWRSGRARRRAPG